MVVRDGGYHLSKCRENIGLLFNIDCWVSDKEKSKYSEIYEIRWSVKGFYMYYFIV